MAFQPHHNLLGLNELHIPHRPAPTRGIEDAATLQDMRDEFVRDVDQVLQWLHRRAKDFRYHGDVEIDPRELCEFVGQTIDEQARYPIDQRIQAMNDAAPVSRTYRQRPQGHGRAA